MPSRGEVDHVVIYDTGLAKVNVKRVNTVRKRKASYLAQTTSCR
ncbi:hypothetical protein BTN49_1114 [Candidatus Enterovibrio escicola]|uniref:Uncharacterized protein n=1 Tax=Candidatus Enterovibrio escicola TaxID=1927127 RepID=A0A2A5T4M3_9GAMM|nr:hypothetical protein BTN49_1114 [Candidatus Enterovibrio escacola]